MDRTRLAILILCIWAPNRAWSGEVSLQPEDLPRLLAERNQNVRGASLLVESSAKRTGYLVRSYLPTIDAGVGGETFHTSRYSNLTQPYGYIEGRVNLFRGGRDLLENDTRSAQLQNAEAQSKRTQAAELLEARTLFWALVYQREVLAVLKQFLQDNEKYLASAQRRIQRGLTSDTDRLDFEINRSELKEQIASLSHEIELTEIKLSAVLVLPESTTIKSLEQIPHDHDDKLVAAPLTSEGQHEIQIARAGAEATRFESSQLGRWWLPSLDVYGGYYQYTTRDRDFLDASLRYDTVAGVRLSLTLFDGLQANSAAGAAGARAEGLELQALQTQRTVQARWRVAQEEMKHDHELTHETETRVEQGKSYLSKTLAEYDRGVKNSPDVLGASLRLLSFRRRSAEVRRDYQLAKAELLAIAGK